MPAQSMTTSEAAKFLGISPGTLTVWRSSGKQRIPYYKVGRRVVYDRQDLTNWLTSRRSTCTSDTASATS